MKLVFVSGQVGVVVENTVGTTHTTNIYVVPWELIVGVTALLCILIWAIVRRRKPAE